MVIPPPWLPPLAAIRAPSIAGCERAASTALMDEICPPSTVFAAYNHYAGEKDLTIWRYNHHEGGAAYQTQAKLRFLRELWG